MPDLNLSARKILKRYSDYPLSKGYGIAASNLKHWFNEHNLISIASVKSRHCSSILERQRYLSLQPRRSLFPFRKRSLPFITRDTTMLVTKPFFSLWLAICFKIMTRYTCGFFPRILAIIPATRYTCVSLSRILAFYSQVYDHFLTNAHIYAHKKAHIYALQTSMWYMGSQKVVV